MYIDELLEAGFGDPLGFHGLFYYDMKSTYVLYVMWPVNVFHRLVSTRAGWRSRFDEIVFHSYYSLIGELFQRLWKYQDLAGNVLIKSYRTVVGIRSSWLLMDGHHASSLDRFSQSSILRRVHPEYVNDWLSSRFNNL